MSGKGLISAHFFIFIGILSSPLSAQDGLSGGIPDDAMPGFISIRDSDLEKHLRFLAGDQAQGRGNMQPGLKIAAEYLAEFYRDNGYASFYDDGRFFQSYELLEIDMASVSLGVETRASRVSVTVDGYHYEIDYGIFKRGLLTSLDLSVEVAFAGYGITAPRYKYDDYATLNVAGKVVLVLAGEPSRKGDDEFFMGSDTRTRFSNPSVKAATAAEHGARALILVSKADNRTPFHELLDRYEFSFSRPVMALPSLPPRLVPVIMVRKSIAEKLLSGGRESLDQLEAKLATSGRPHSFIARNTKLKLKIDLQAKRHILQNVVAYMEGSDPQLKNEYVVISAHYDHFGTSPDGDIFYGADDNGTGTSGLLEIAAALKENNNAPRRSIVFLHVSAEEMGLLGSTYFANYPLVEISDIVANLNIDMVGRNDPDSIYVIGTNILSWELHHIGETAIRLVPDFDISYKYNDPDDSNRFYYRSDHFNFARRNIPITFYFAGVHEDYHQTTDTVDKINLAKVRKVAQLVYLTAWEIANRDERPALDGLSFE